MVTHNGNNFLVFFFFLCLQLVYGADYPRQNEKCISGADCFTDFEYCSIDENDITGVCEHKKVENLLTLEYIGCVVTFVLLFISNCGGLGGGGALIPVAMVFFGFDTKQAIA